MRPVRGDLMRAEFDALEATVRYWEGRATPAEISEASRRVRALRIAAEFERRQVARLPGWLRSRPSFAIGH